MEPEHKELINWLKKRIKVQKEIVLGAEREDYTFGWIDSNFYGDILREEKAKLEELIDTKIDMERYCKYKFEEDI